MIRYVALLFLMSLTNFTYSAGAAFPVSITPGTEYKSHLVGGFYRMHMIDIPQNGLNRFRYLNIRVNQQLFPSSATKYVYLERSTYKNYLIRIPNSGIIALNDSIKRVVVKLELKGGTPFSPNDVTRADRINYQIKATLSGGYLLSQPQAIGDVLARDLNNVGAAIGGILGHNGIWDGSNVIEVGPTTSSNSNVVHKNTFTNFVKNSTYWGARYGKGSRAQHLTAVREAWEERLHDPEYVYHGTYREGGSVLKYRLLYKHVNPWGGRGSVSYRWRYYPTRAAAQRALDRAKTGYNPLKILTFISPQAFTIKVKGQLFWSSPAGHFNLRHFKFDWRQIIICRV